MVPLNVDGDRAKHFRRSLNCINKFSFHLSWYFLMNNQTYLVIFSSHGLTVETRPCGIAKFLTYARKVRNG
jgi:hypothetical protein